MADPAVPSSTQASGSTEAAAQQRLLLHMPVDVRSVSLAILALMASLYTMRWAKDVLIPILLGVMLSYALTPIVNRFERWRVPRALTASGLLAAIALAIGWGGWSLSDGADALLQTVPQVTQKIREMTERRRGTVSTIEKVQQAAIELEAVANATSVPAAASVPSAPAPQAQRAGSTPRAADAARSAGTAANGGAGASAAAPPIRAHIDIRGYVLSGTLGALAFLGQISVVLLIALFLMASGNNFRRKMVKLAGPKLSQKKVTLETLDEITDQIQRYLLVQVGVSILVGIATGLAFYAIGVQQAAVWGVVAGVTNLIPYLGAVIVGIGSAVVGLVQFGTVDMAVLVGGTSMAIHAVIGNLLTPWWMGRASRMSPFAVFVAVLVFGWLWGIPGLLLGVPILMVVKSVCDRVDDLKPVGELLGA